jgi:hypothetical protein
VRRRVAPARRLGPQRARRRPERQWAAAAVGALIIVRHRANIGRLLRGEEARRAARGVLKEASMEQALVIGGGGWGRRSRSCSTERGAHVTLFVHDADYGAEMARSRRNPRYLPGIEIPERIAISSDPKVLAAMAPSSS